MSSLIVTAFHPSEFCGVGDYSQKLASALGAGFLNIQRWSLSALRTISQAAQSGSYPVIHIQYPSMGMGKSPTFALAPLWLWRQKVFLTLHEFSIFSLSRKLYCLPYILFAQGIIFSNEYEKQQFKHFYRWGFAPLHVIPIGSNITPKGAINPTKARDIGLIHFGQITAGKGIETFLDVAEALRRQGFADIIVLAGASTPENPYLNGIASRLQQAKITLQLNLPEAELSLLLNRTRLAILPFPDGISEKRGSALACLKHGVGVITRHSHKTPQWLKDITQDYTTAEAVSQSILSGEANTLDPEQLAAIEEKQCGWKSIAARHQHLYQQ